MGVIQAGNLTIEILPKTDRERTTAENKVVGQLDAKDAQARQDWHTVLLEMLRECRLLRINQVDKASLNLKSNSILETYLELFLTETEKLLHEGLVKKYRKEDANKLAMKGQLLFGPHIARNLVHRERFYIRYAEYNRVNLFNQILYKTLCLIPLISSDPYLADKVNRLLFDFPEMPDCAVSQSTFDKLVYDRKTDRYREALLISKMLLLNFRPDITGGNENVIAILFDMNKLWEEFVYRRLKKEESHWNVTVYRQQAENFWKSGLHNRIKTIRPDIVLENNETNEITVIDTKWKILKDLIPSDEDLKQMFVYNIFWNCRRSILLYPSSVDSANHGKYYECTDVHTGECSVYVINPLDSAGRISAKFGELLMNDFFP